MRILVVDDEPIVAHTVSLVLRKHGFEATIANSADDALSSALRNPPDLVLSDIDMPGRDGIALMEDLGHHLPLCPILVLTASWYAQDRAAAYAQNLGQTIRVLSKPCPPTLLVRTASSLLEAHQAGSSHLSQPELPLSLQM